MAETDLLIAIGPRLGELTTSGYTTIQAPVPKQNLAHIFPAAEELGRVCEPTVALVSDTESFCKAAAKWVPIAPGIFATRREDLRAGYEHFNDLASLPDDPIAPIFGHLRETAPADAILCNGAGNYSACLHRFHRYRAPGTQLAPTSGSMGYGLPGAIGAAITAPKREVYAIAGDGCFMMTCQELATACHHGLRLTVIDTGRYETIRAHQEREFPDRVSGTALTTRISAPLRGPLGPMPRGVTT